MSNLDGRYWRGISLVYHICNRVIYRGFNTYPGGKQKITKADGKQVAGRWLSGQLIEIAVETPQGVPPKMPLLCLSVPGKRMRRISEHTVCINTISQFSGTFLNQDWGLLTNAKQKAWLKDHAAEEWIGEPVFEGDIFYHRVEKRYYIVVYDICKGFYLENMSTGSACGNWIFDLMVKRGSLWAPPKEATPETILRYHKKRGAESREEALSLAAFV